MLISLSGRGTKQNQLYEALKAAILTGSLSPGEKVPASRSLAKDLKLSRNTVQACYEQLHAEGFLESRRGSGTFVTLVLPDSGHYQDDDSATTLTATPPLLSRFGQKAAALEGRPDISRNCDIAFEYGAPDVDSFPWPVWRRLLSQAAHQQAQPSLSGYGDPAGLWELRRALVDYLRYNRGLAVKPEQIVITGGSQQALDLIARVLANPEDTIAIEEPGYLGARIAFEASEAQVISIPVDEEGLKTDLIEALQPTPKLIYVTPSHQFPLGGVLPLQRRLTLLDWAKRHDCWIIEDDYDSEFRYDHGPIKAMAGLSQNAPVIYMGTLSKALFPALRLGFIVAPEALATTIAKARWMNDRQSPTLEQIAMARFLQDGHFERHLNRCRKKYAQRRALLINELKKAFGADVKIEGDKAGIHLSIWLHQVPAHRLGQLQTSIREARVGVGYLERYYATPPKIAGLLLGFSTVTEDEIIEGVKRLKACYADVLHHHDQTASAF